MKHRVAKLREWLAGSSLDTMLVSRADNRVYLSGFTGSAGYLLVSMDKAILATDFRYIEQAKEQAPDFEVFKLEAGLVKSLPDLVEAIGAKRVGFEADDMTFAEYQELRNTLPVEELEMEPTVAILERVRSMKDEIELGHIAQASQIADAAFAHVLSILKPGMTERQVAWELEKAMRDRGADGLAFDIIVAAGRHSALPHARPSDRHIGEGEPIVVDWGARVQGYCSDCTRTVILGGPDEMFAKIYNIVLQAQRAAMKSVYSGVPAAEVDGVARQIITDAGYGEAFGHGLGHGVGLAIHELPVLRRTSEDHLGEGQVFSIEPGIYLPDWGGVRIEDIFTIEQGELKPLTKVTKIEEIGEKR